MLLMSDLMVNERDTAGDIFSKLRKVEKPCRAISQALSRGGR